MYDWNAPLPPCDWCDEATDEEVPWVDTEDFWGHAECATAWRLTAATRAAARTRD